MTPETEAILLNAKAVLLLADAVNTWGYRIAININIWGCGICIALIIRNAIAMSKK